MLCIGNMKKLKTCVLNGLVLIVCLFALVLPARAQAETAYERVIKTGTLRCGYGVFEPMVMRDANTGALSGIFYDLMQEIAKVSGLKVEFVEEIDWGQITEALKSGKIDAHCAGMWGTGKRGTVMAFSDPLFYGVAAAAVRVDDNRFDNNIEAMNDAAVRLSINDGDVSEDIANRMFPKAQRVAKPQNSGEEYLLMNVVTNKADASFTAPSIVRAFIEKNPNTLKFVPMKIGTLGINQHVIGVEIHEQELQDLLNAAVAELKNNGVIERIFAKYPAEQTADFILNTKE
jgi:ABC-type amino acid transport substrate-binding protein